MKKCGTCENFQTVSTFERTGICQYKGFRTMEHEACEHYEEEYAHSQIDDTEDLYEDSYYGC